VRVVSLVPSITETLLAWREPVAACTRFCEQPTLPTVGGTKDPGVAAVVAEVQRLLPSSRVVLVDGRALLWWGVRTPTALERLRAVLREQPAPR